MAKNNLDDTAFMDELEAAARLRPHSLSNLLLLSICGLVAFFVIWASVSTIEEITRGTGQVVPSQDVQMLQSLEGGILAELLVREGQLVEKGQILMRISDVQFASEERGAEARQFALQAKKARLDAEAKGESFAPSATLLEKAPTLIANEKALYDSRQKELANAIAILKDQGEKARAGIAETNAQIKRLNDSRALLSQELQITERMVAQQAVPKVEEIRLRRELNNLSGELRANQERSAGLRAELSAAENQLRDQHDKFRSQALGELSGVEAELSQLAQSQTFISDRVARTELRAPVAGIVNNIALTTVGGVVEPAQKLVEIVPVDDELKIIARVTPNDIAFLKAGQAVKVRITAYDSQRYGGLDGTLVRVGANSVKDHNGDVFFEIEVHTEKNYLGTEAQPLPITPGMVAETDIITGRKTIMEYLVKPVLRLRDRALTER